MGTEVSWPHRGWPDKLTGVGQSASETALNSASLVGHKHTKPCSQLICEAGRVSLL